MFNSVIEFIQTAAETMMYLGAVSILITLLSFSKQKMKIYAEDMMQKPSIQQVWDINTTNRNKIEGASVLTSIMSVVDNPELQKVSIDGAEFDKNKIRTCDPETIREMKERIKKFDQTYIVESTYGIDGEVIEINYRYAK